MLLALFLGTFGSSRPSVVRVEDCFLPFLLGGFSIEFGQNLCIRFTSKTIILDSVPQFFQQIETRIENLSVCNLSNQSTLVTNTVIRDLVCTLSLLLVCIPAQEFGGPPNFSGLRDDHSTMTPHAEGKLLDKHFLEHSFWLKVLSETTQER